MAASRYIIVITSLETLFLSTNLLINKIRIENVMNVMKHLARCLCCAIMTANSISFDCIKDC